MHIQIESKKDIEAATIGNNRAVIIEPTIEP